jgi:hypothetical protein
MGVLAGRYLLLSAVKRIFLLKCAREFLNYGALRWARESELV